MVGKPSSSPVGTLLLTIANILIPVCIVVFAIGFFPYKPYLPGLAEYENLEYGKPPDAPFDKLVFMVVDALRSDFVYAEGSGFEYTQSLIRDGQAIPFTANARSPTVTMPKLKSITTGSVPSFVDLILNFDEADTSSTLAAQDTWLAQLKRKGNGKLLLYGDDTWLKLFPGTFDRHDGTSSFFVSDFTEVDNNVTRHIPDELENKDWSLMVLHYLGLDHIGHKSGPKSSNMVPKQKEMDGIVKQIFSAMESKPHLQSTLFVMCGDHGMNDAGNHGASSPGETSPALVFMSPKLKKLASKATAPALPANEFDYYEMVEQSDIAPTLAALLGFPVSKNNLGAMIPDFLPFWPASTDKVQILIRNARQIINIVTAAFGSEIFDTYSSTDPCKGDSEINELACEWSKINNQARAQSTATTVDATWLSSTSEWIRKAQDLMSSMASNYDMGKLYLGQGAAFLAVFLCLTVAISEGTYKRGFILPLLSLAISYGIMMSASSYVEEEQHFWYWCSTIWLAFLGANKIATTRRFSSAAWPVLALLALRLTRSWNQTGQKYAGEPDIVKIFVSQYPQLLWAAIIIAYLLIWFHILPSLEELPIVVSAAFTSILMSSAFAFKLAFTVEDAPELVAGFAKSLNGTFQGQSLVWRARTIFILSAITIAYGAYLARRGGRYAISASRLIHEVITIICMTQSRAANIPLFLLARILFQNFNTSLTLVEITTTSILFQYTSFFAFGGSNAISSVDLSSAYNGISGFNVIAVGVLTLVSNWAGAIYWTSATNLFLLDKYRQGGTAVFKNHATMLSLFATTSVAFMMVACTNLRTHLFIWTVFSPKYLYCMAWALGQHLLINLGLGGLLFWISAR